MKKTLLKFLMLGGVILTLHACKKETEKQINPDKGSNHSLMRDFTFDNWPRVENGMLVFDDANHVSDYLEFLNQSIAIPEGEEWDSVANDPNSILQSIENTLGFTSIRSISQANWEQLAEIGWNTLDEIPDKHFINSDAIKSILNSSNDVRVGDKITHCINKDFAVEIPEDYNLLQLVHELDNLGEAITMADIVTIDTTIKVIHLSKLEHRKENLFKTTNGYQMIYPDVTSPDLCNDPTKIELEGMAIYYLDLVNGPVFVKGHFYVDWGDGSHNTFTSSAGQNNSVVTNCFHNYPATGTYTITIYASTNAGVSPSLYSASYSFTAQVPTSSCNYGVNKETGWNWNLVPNDPYNRAWAGKCWVKMWTNFFGKDRHSTGAATEVFIYKNGKWKRNRTDMVGAVYSVTKYGANCSTAWGSAGSSYPQNCKDAKIEHDDNGHFGWQSLYAIHNIRIGSNWYTYNQTINPCQ